MRIVNALTIDVEDYFQVSNMESVVDRSSWKSYPLRVGDNTRKILSILEEFDVKATFFILGWVADAVPELVVEIAKKGHELACHGYDHQLVHKQDWHSFRADVLKARRIIEDIAGVPLLGYRAPSFSINSEGCRWALDVLAEEGFVYDSSIYFTETENQNRNPSMYEIKTNSSRNIIEFPVSTLNLAGKPFIPIGGGYLRLLPVRVIKWAISELNKRSYPAMVYLHPWELDPLQPRLPVGGLNRFRHYVNLSKTEEKLRALLKEFDFSTASFVIEKTMKKRLLPLNGEMENRK
ncbi:MAG TPA: XrtA system polysaccharide deacetylase [Candidatus Hypogeohydataceae bacterium YC40]